MSRLLHRPMFRRGGSTGEGITSGLRRGYADGNNVPEVSHRGMPTFKSSSNGSNFNLTNYLSEPPPLPKSSAGADFWLNLGTNILAQPGGRPILQTLGTAGREPLARYQQQRSQEDLLKYKHAQGERQFQLEIYKAMTDEEKINLQKEIDYLMNEHGLSKAEALAQAMPKYRKPMNPADVERQAKERERDQILEDAAATRAYLSKEEGESISIPQAIVINEFYAKSKEQGWEYDTTPFIDKTAIREEWSKNYGKAQDHWLHPKSGNIAIPPDLQGDYKEGLYYVDSFNGDVYLVGPGSTELVKVVIDEEIIN
jgi:hypothetical protein